MKKYLLVLFVIFSIVGCSFKLIGDFEAKSFYVLNDLRENRVEKLGENLPLLILRETFASRYVNSQKIVYSQTSATRGSYQYASWFEPPTKRFSLLLKKRLADVGFFASSANKESGPIEGYQLNTEIVDLYHDIQEEPGVAIVVVNAELINLNNYHTISHRVFEKKIEAKSFDAEGAVEAFSEGITKILDQMIDWIKSSLQSERQIQ